MGHISGSRRMLLDAPGLPQLRTFRRCKYPICAENQQQSRTTQCAEVRRITVHHISDSRLRRRIFDRRQATCDSWLSFTAESALSQYRRRRSGCPSICAKHSSSGSNVLKPLETTACSWSRRFPKPTSYLISTHLLQTRRYLNNVHPEGIGPIRTEWSVEGD